MRMIFLSPHYDDAVFSCGGLIWELIHVGYPVEVWTICAGEPPKGKLSPFALQLHQRWGNLEDVVPTRRKENQEAAAILGFSTQQFSVPDCIYRHSENGEYFYTSEASLFSAIHPGEKLLLDKLALELARRIPPDGQLIAPLGIGNHVDHQLTKQAAEINQKPIWYYADFPYVLKDPGWQEKWLRGYTCAFQRSISDRGLKVWLEAVLAYHSQISTFWTNENQLGQDLEKLTRQNEGGILWHRETSTPN